MRIRNRVLLLMMGFLTLAMTGFAWVLYQVQYQALESGLDIELTTAVVMVQELLPPDYSSRVINVGTISQSEYNYYTDRLNSLSTKANIDYLWVEMQLGNQIVYIAGSPKQGKPDQGELKYLSSLHPDRDFYARLIENQQIHYEDGENRSGKVRVVLVPFSDETGHIYLIGAGRSMQRMEAQMQSTLYSSLVVIGIVLLLAGWASWLLANSMAKPIETVTEVAGRIANGQKVPQLETRGGGELRHLTESINAMNLAIREREERLEEVLNNTVVALYKRNYRLDVYDYISPAITAITGYSVDEMLNKSTNDVIKLLYPEDAICVLEKLQKIVASGGGIFREEYRFYHKNGEIRWALDTARIFLDDAGQPYTGIGSLEDITERKQTEKALRESEQQFRSLTETLPVGVVLMGRDGVSQYFNQVFSQNLGYYIEDIPTLNEWWPKAYPDETYRNAVQIEWNARVERFIQTGDPFETMDTQVTCKNGSVRSVEFRLALMDDLLLIVLSDQTERKQTEEALRTSDTRFRSLFDNMSEGVALHRLVYDDNRQAIDYEIIDINTQYEAVLNLTRETVVNKLSTQIYGMSVPPYINEYVSVVETGTPYHFETYFAPMQKYFYISVARMDVDQFATIFFDITEIKRKEAEINHLSSFPRLNPNLVLEINRQGKVLYANPSTYELLALAEFNDPHVLLPANFEEIFTSLAISENKKMYWETEFGGRYLGQTFSYVAETDTVRLYSIDITERRQVEEALRNSRDRLLRAEEIGASGNWELELDTRKMRASEGAARIYGLNGLEWPLEIVQTVPLPEYRSALDLALKNLITRDSPYDIEFKMHRQDNGELRDIHSVAKFDSARRVIFGVIQDVTERKYMENALRESEERFRRITNEMVDLVAQFDEKANYVYVSPSYEKILGYCPDELIGKPAIIYLHPDGLEATVQEIGIMLDRGEGSIQFQYRHKNGHYLWFESTGRSIKNADGVVIGSIMASRDITDRKRVEEEVRLLNVDLERRVQERTAQLEASNRELEAFAYSVSHDLRAPLRSIDGFSQAILEDIGSSLDETSLGYLERVRAAARRMGLLIDNLLKLSRVTRSEMAFSEVDLGVMARRVAEELQSMQPDRQVAWIIDEDVTARGDEKLLEVVLNNLLTNAWKFTSQHATARIEFGVTSQDGLPVYFVRDDGVGFDMTYSDKLFGVFQRLHNVSAFEGTGIGLATVQRIIHRHGGDVWAVGETENGATFYFTLRTPLHYHVAI